MLQTGQDLPFVTESPDDGVRIHSAAQHLDRNPLLKGIVIGHCQIYRAHTAAANFANQSVWTDQCVGRIVDVGICGSREVVWNGQRSISKPSF